VIDITQLECLDVARKIGTIIKLTVVNFIIVVLFIKNRIGVAYKSARAYTGFKSP